MGIFSETFSGATEGTTCGLLYRGAIEATDSRFSEDLSSGVSIILAGVLKGRED